MTVRQHQQLESMMFPAGLPDCDKGGRRQAVSGHDTLSCCWPECLEDTPLHAAQHFIQGNVAGSIRLRAPKCEMYVCLKQRCVCDNPARHGGLKDGVAIYLCEMGL